MLSKYMLERSTIDTARVSKRLVDMIPEDLLEAARGELLTPQLPVRPRCNRVRVRLQPVLGKNLVVELTQSLRPARVLLESLARQLVMIDDGDMCVDVLTVCIVVDDNHVLSAESCTGELTGNIQSTFDVLWLANVELLGVEREDEVVHLVLASMSASLSLGVLDERLGGVHRARIPCCSRRAVCHVLTVLLAAPIQRVRHRVASTQTARDLHVRTHSRVPSPRLERNSVITEHASSSNTSSTTTLIDSPSLRARAMSRRKPSKVVPILRSVSTFAPST